MILSWMLIASLVALAASVAALALEGAARALRRPTRWSWLAALVFSTLWPCWLAVRGAMQPVGNGPSAGPVMLPPILVSAGRVAVTAVTQRLAPLDAHLSSGILTLWALITLALIGRLFLGVQSLGKQRTRWVERDVDGVRVLVAPATGPAVIGVRRPAIVLPEWVLDLEPKLLRLVLRHEAQHLRSRDTVLRLVGAVLPALMPWNIALWWLASRLSLGIEMDCDDRVLRADVPRERYGLLLLAIAQRQSTTLLAPALSEPTSHLERRVTAMQLALPSRPLLTSAGFTLIAGICVAAACSAPSPSSPAGLGYQQKVADRASAERDAANGIVRIPPAVVDPEAYSDTRVDKQAAPMPGNPSPYYPDVLEAAGISGQVIVQFVIDTSGRPEMNTFKVLKSDNDLFVKAVRDVLFKQRFYPAEVGGRHVKELVTTPYVFNMKS